MAIDRAPTSLEHTLGRLVSGRLDPRTLPADQVPAVIQLARRHGLAPMLLWSLQQAGVDDGDLLWEPLAASVGRWKLDYLLKTTAQAEVQAALTDAGIPTIWLKGIALAHTIYPAPILRPMGDIDVLVPYPQRKAALAVAESLGYHKHSYEPELFETYDELRHHYHLLGHVENLVALELHFRLLMGDRLLDRQETEWFWHQTRPVRGQDLAFTSLAPEAHLLYLCAHAILHHGEIQFYLQRYFDLHRLLLETPALDWDLVLERAVAFRWTYAVVQALGYAQQYFATPLPAGLIFELERRRPSGEEILYATRQKSDYVVNLLHQLRVMDRSAGAELALRTIFPSPSYMRFFYDTDATWGLFPYYVIRLLYFVREIARVGIQWRRVR